MKNDKKHTQTSTGSHIDDTNLEKLLENFFHDVPFGDSRDLARYMYDKGFEARTAKAA